jgi:hypothetical protein
MDGIVGVKRLRNSIRRVKMEFDKVNPEEIIEKLKIILEKKRLERQEVKNEKELRNTPQA